MNIKSYMKYRLQKRKAKSKKTKLNSTHLSRDIKYGNYCIFGEKCYIDRNVEIGDFNYFNANQLEVLVESNTRMGSFCSIAPGVMIGLGNHDVYKVTTHPILFNPYYSKLMNEEFSGNCIGLADQEEVTMIGSDVWIGARATINRGIRVGNGAVIAGEAVVTKDVPAYTIVGGIPAKIIGYRFEQNIINFLNENSDYTFWNWDETFLKKHLSDLNDIETYMKSISTFKNQKK